MAKEEVRKFKTNKFYYYAQEYMTKATADEEIMGIDMTNEFWDEIEEEIMNDELIDININAKVRMSKSTTGIHLAMKIYEMMIRIKKLEGKEPFNMRNVARTQQEYSKMMRDYKLNFSVVLTDEISEAENTGENITVEKALEEDYSNIQAGRYVHRVSCSPKNVADANADIFFEIVSVDRKAKITHAHLYYKMFKGGNEYMQLLGYVNFYVGDLIEIWDKHVKKRFFRNLDNPNENDKKVINYWRKRDFYTEYMVKKYEKMDLVNKEGVTRPRELDYAEVILEIEEKLRPLARIGNVLSKDIIKSYVNITYKRHKIPTSIVGEEITAQRVNAILGLWKAYFKLNYDLSALDRALDNEKITKEAYDRQTQIIKEMQVGLMEAIQAQREEWQRYVEINKKYNEVLSDGRGNKEDKKDNSGA